MTNRRDPDPRTLFLKLPRRRQNAILAYVNTIQTADLEPLAIFLKGLRPDTPDEQIAHMLGVSRATLARWKVYQAVKPRLKDSPYYRPPPTKFRRTKDGRWALDHPDHGHPDHGV
jgi:hypothetical protein